MKKMTWNDQPTQQSGPGRKSQGGGGRLHELARCDVSGTMTVSVAGYEIEIDQDGFAAAGSIFVRLPGSHNLPVNLNAADALASAIQRVARIARELETLRT